MLHPIVPYHLHVDAKEYQLILKRISPMNEAFEKQHARRTIVFELLMLSDARSKEEKKRWARLTIDSYSSSFFNRIDGTRTFISVNACFFSACFSLLSLVCTLYFFLVKLRVQPVMLVFCIKTLQSRSRRE